VRGGQRATGAGGAPAAHDEVSDVTTTTSQMQHGPCDGMPQGPRKEPPSL
jgi:hypothetical protein